MAVQQLKYYLYLLKQKNIIVTGELLVPKENLKEIVILETKDISIIEKQLENIRNICNEDTPPKIIKEKFCSKCAYFELCYI